MRIEMLAAINTRKSTEDNCIGDDNPLEGQSYRGFTEVPLHGET